MESTFKRGLDDGPLEKVIGFFETGVGREIKRAAYDNGKSVFQICIRDNYINVYWNGCSVLKYAPRAKENEYLIHHKYINGSGVKGASPYVRLAMVGSDLTTKRKEKEDWSFVKHLVEKVKSDGLAGYGEKGEKKGLADYLSKVDDTFLDLEIAFSRKTKSKKTKKEITVANRIDLARLKQLDDGSVVLQLVEVKMDSDSRLRSIPENTPEVMTQMKYYQDFITDSKAVISDSYLKVARNYEKLDFLGFGKSQRQLIRKFMESPNPKIDKKPYLLILKDKALKGEKLKLWEMHFERLEKLFTAKEFDTPEIANLRS